MTTLILDHLWQSTLFAGGVALLVLLLRKNSANVRYYLWFAASAKFLLPFAALTTLASAMLKPVAAPVAMQMVLLLQPVAQPFSAPGTQAAAASFDVVPYLLALWGLGAAGFAARWIMRWVRLHRMTRDANEIAIAAPVRVKMAATVMEPGLVGIWRPIIILPEGITERLSEAEIKAVLAHEICHMKRRDNLLAAAHMVVETLFWFHPLVWWLGARLNAEREHACDESVLADGETPHIYAESILKVCKFYVQSPLACAAGISGADLKKRMEIIMESRFSLRMNTTKKLLLAGAAAIAFAVPITVGLLTSPPVLAQAAAAGPAATTFASSTPSGQTGGVIAGGRITPAIAKCLNDYAAKVEAVEPDLSKATEYLMNTICAGPVVTELQRTDGQQRGEFQSAVVSAAGQLILDRRVGHANWNSATPSAVAQAVAVVSPHPGTEAWLRRYIAGRQNGQTDMTSFPAFPNRRTPTELVQADNRYKSLGKLTSLTFLGRREYSDAYAATFEHGKKTYNVGSLTALGAPQSFTESLP